MSQSIESNAAAGKGRILVVDDDRLVLATVTHGLAQAGYEVIDADNGDDAILLARQHRPALALLDIRMEGKTGFDVAEYLRDVAGIPFMFLSAFADEPTRAQAEALGAKAYLIKPLDVGQIVPTVDRVMASLRGTGSASPLVAAPAVAPSAAKGEPKAPIDVVALATGILMHRHTLTCSAATQKLQALARDKGLSSVQQAQRLVDAVEALADTDR